MPSKSLLRRLGGHYRKHFGGPGSVSRERLFISSVFFFLTFGAVRALTYAVRAGLVGNVVTAGGRHIHHLVWGILLLLLVGYSWLLRVGSGADHTSRWMSRLTAMLFGVGAALTLDEFALWLDLRDVYWEREGRKSVDAVLLFGGLLSVGVWGGGFFRSVAAEVWRSLRSAVGARGG
jgi:hypothetical protein